MGTVKISEGTIAIGALICFSAWLFIGLPILNTPSERIQYYEATHKPPDHSTPEPKGTSQAPFFVEVVPASKSAEERTQEAEEREEKRLLDRRLANWTVVLGAATIGLILATALLGFFAWRQAGDTKEALHIAGTQSAVAKLTFAASVTIDRPAAVRLMTTDGEPAGARFWVTFENAGNSATQSMIQQISAYAGPPDLFVFANVTGAAADPQPLVIGPHRTIDSGWVEMSEFLSGAKERGEVGIFVCGWAEYNDVFPDTPRHRVEYCFEVQWQDRADGAREYRFELYGPHNRHYDIPRQAQA